jgi:hypothetical protein
MKAVIHTLHSQLARRPVMDGPVILFNRCSKNVLNVCEGEISKGRFAQAFRWAIKLAILLKTSTFKKSNLIFV